MCLYEITGARGPITNPFVFAARQKKILIFYHYFFSLQSCFNVKLIYKIFSLSIGL